MPYLTVDEQQLFYTHQPGPMGGLNLILVHGAGGSHLDWPAELRRLPNTAVYALDLPGHGRSAKPGRTTINAYTNDVLAFIRVLNLPKVVVTGHSMGGAIAQTIGLRQPPQLAGLVLVGTGARLRVLDAILEGVLADFETAVSTVTQYAWAQDAPAELTAQTRKMLLQADPVVMHGDYTACNNFDVMGQLPHIPLPTLVISGTADLMTPVKYGRYLAGHIPHAQMVIIEGGGHMMALEQPEPVTTAITQFLTRLP